MPSQPYHEPVSKLLALGRPQGRDWLDYLALGLARADIPELLRMAQDNDLRFIEPSIDQPDDEDLPQWYAPVHAWRALGQLRAEEVMPFMLDTLRRLEQEDDDDDWLSNDASQLSTLIGPPAIPLLAAFLADSGNPTYARCTAIESLEDLVAAYPETREACVAAVLPVLRDHANNDETVNGFLVSTLLALDAALENIELIEEVFETDNIDPSVDGDIEDIKIRLGLLEERITPRRLPFSMNDFADIIPTQQPKLAKKAAKKEKNKHKQEKKSRKKNRKKGK